ncbi:MAG TPA: hypothetical protein O0X23_04755 [Methanocorpusculum sp.]|nr:hypothetical protein [Methanocorpusculum sp.]
MHASARVGDQLNQGVARRNDVIDENEALVADLAEISGNASDPGIGVAFGGFFCGNQGRKRKRYTEGGDTNTIIASTSLRLRSLHRVGSTTGYNAAKKPGNHPVDVHVFRDGWGWSFLHICS